MNYDTYENPLVTRYASKELTWIWSQRYKFTTWRKLWLALARAEKELGLPITDEQIEEMEANLHAIDFKLAEEKEREFRHDVMGHIYAYGAVCPQAKPILHLGATSCYVTDNSELILIKESMEIIRRRMIRLLSVLRDTALQYKSLPTLGFTHYQPAQLTTVGKRVCLWLYDFLLDFQELENQMKKLPFRGVKGTTGTQASFLELFDGDHSKVIALDKRVGSLMGFGQTIPLCGQTYTRKVDYQIVSMLSGIAQSAYKMAGDIRHLMNLKEVDEPFEKDQVGSSAMAYKRNPMRSERICALARFAMSLTENTANTHASQWFERSLDDSANRRIVLPESFLTVDAILRLSINVIDGITVWPVVIQKHINEELPFMATESVLMVCVKAGGDRQRLHEAIRVHSMASARCVKEEGKANDLLERISKDPLFEAVHDKLEDLMDSHRFTGRAAAQVDEFLSEYVTPVLDRYRHITDESIADNINV